MFGLRKVTPAPEAPDLLEALARIEGELRRVESQMRVLETEQTVMHDQVRKWMRRAVAAERAVERHQEQPEAVPAAAPAATPARPLTMWGARARIARRKLAALAAPNGNGSGAEGAEEE